MGIRSGTHITTWQPQDMAMTMRRLLLHLHREPSVSFTTRSPSLGGVGVLTELQSPDLPHVAQPGKLLPLDLEWILGTKSQLLHSLHV